MNRYLKPAVFVLTVALLLVVFIFSVYGRMQNEKFPKMYIHEAAVDLGDFYEGEDIEHIFVVRNNGEGELEIKVKPG